MTTNLTPPPQPVDNFEQEHTMTNRTAFHQGWALAHLANLSDHPKADHTRTAVLDAILEHLAAQPEMYQALITVIIDAHQAADR